MGQTLSTIYYRLALKRQTLSLVIGTIFACACMDCNWSLVLVGYRLSPVLVKIE